MSHNKWLKLLVERSKRRRRKEETKRKRLRLLPQSFRLIGACVLKLI
jgi:hypothetical protein